MTRADELGPVADRVRRRQHARTLVTVLAVALVLVILLVANKNPAQDRTGIPVTPQPEGSREDILRAEAVRQAEAERQKEAQLQRELEQQATERLKRVTLDKLRRNVMGCASSVRERSKFSSFDAYVTGEHGETVHFFGTAEEQFQFQKCMAEHGHPLSKIEDTKK